MRKHQRLWADLVMSDLDDNDFAWKNKSNADSMCLYPTSLSGNSSVGERGRIDI